MCGFAAIVSLTGAPVDVDRLRRMTAMLRHRGPDDEGYLVARPGVATAARGLGTLPEIVQPPLETLAGGAWTFGLGVRRLAVRDPGAAGHQPMGDPDGVRWLAFNGEIYGDGDLRRELSAGGWRFTSRSDTETLLAAWSRHGAASLERLNGMFACALWDGRARRLTCARDRFGIKPLYYLQLSDRVLVASEIKGILAGLDHVPAPAWPVVVDYVASGLSDHTGETFFDGIRQLPPGHLLEVDGHGVTLRSWDRGVLPLAAGPDADRAAQFHRALTGAVDDHLVADVPVGAALSGGLDSATIVMAASRPGARAGAGAPLDVFTAGFDDRAIDERRYAQAVATEAGARSHVVRIEPAALLADLPRLLWHQDEPVVSTSVLAQWQVMKRAAVEGVRVVLDGQGGDELLGGYPALVGPHLADLFRAGRWRALLRDARAAAEGAGGTPLHPLARAAFAQVPATCQSLIARLIGRQVRGLHADLVGYWRPVAREPVNGVPEPYMTAALETLVRTTSLPALLRFLDRNGMAWSVEPRVPFLDARVVRAARALSGAERFANGLSKWVLRDPRWSALPALVRERRTKNGFLTPEAAWWRGELRTWAADVLDPASVARHGVLDGAAVARVRDGLCSGAPAPPVPLWRWINIELWMSGRARRDQGPPG